MVIWKKLQSFRQVLNQFILALYKKNIKIECKSLKVFNKKKLNTLIKAYRVSSL